MIMFAFCFRALKLKIVGWRADEENVNLKLCGRAKAKITVMLPCLNGLHCKYMQLFLINSWQSPCIFLESRNGRSSVPQLFMSIVMAGHKLQQPGLQPWWKRL